MPGFLSQVMSKQNYGVNDRQCSRLEMIEKEVE